MSVSGPGLAWPGLAWAGTSHVLVMSESGHGWRSGRGQIEAEWPRSDRARLYTSVQIQ